METNNMKQDNKPLIMSAEQAQKALGLGRKSFKELEKGVRFLRLGRRKKFVWDDLISGLERMKEEPCITSRSTSISRQKVPTYSHNYYTRFKNQRAAS
jgi:hypothetical protein